MVYIDQGDGSAQYGHTHKGDPSRAWSESMKAHGGKRERTLTITGRSVSENQSNNQTCSK